MFNFSQKKLGKDTETTATFQTSLKKVSDDFQELFARSFIEVLISKIAVEPGGSSINRRHMPTLYRDTSLYSGLKLNDVPPRTDAIKQGFMFKVIIARADLCHFNLPYSTFARYSKGVR